MPPVVRAFRVFRRQPLVSVLAVAALGLGIGLTTTMFSILNGAVLRGLPFERSDRILHLAPFDMANDDDFPASHWEFAAWRERQTSFEALAGFSMATANVVGADGAPERYQGAWITTNTLSLLGVRPSLGRDFRPDEERPGAAPVVIVSDRLWRDRLGGRPDALGQTLRVNGTATTVVGVMPPKFAFPVSEDLWVALQLNTAFDARDTVPGLEVIGRLKDGVSRDTASAEMATIVAQLAPEDSKRRDGGFTAEVKTYVEEFMGSRTIGLLTAMFFAVSLVLVIACVNVANLVLARAADRTRDVAVRTALGAGRGQIVVDTLCEVAVLALAGGALGLALATVGAEAFTQGIRDTHPPFWIDVRVDRVVAAFVLGITVLSVLVAGLVPAVRASRGDVLPLLQDEGRGSTSLSMGRLSRGLVVAEMALSFALLVASGFVGLSIVHLARLDPGFSTRDVFAARLALPASDYPDPSSRGQFTDRLADRIAAVPGVTSVAFSTYLPPSAQIMPMAIPGRSYPNERAYPRARLTRVSSRYFETLRLRVLEGRAFVDTDRPGSTPVAIVGSSFARRHYPEGAVGRQVLVVSDGTPPVWRTIVGIVPDVLDASLGDQTAEAVYLALAQEPAGFVTLLAQVSGDPLAIASAVRAGVTALDPNLPIFNVTTVQRAIDESTWVWRVFASLFTTFGAAALILAAIGLYGVMAFSVSRRTQEFGVRLAVGADSGSLVRMVLQQGARQIAVGIVLGVGLAVALSRALKTMFFQVDPSDLRVFTAVAVLLLGTGLAAAFVPARRASRVDPMTALRSQ